MPEKHAFKFVEQGRYVMKTLVLAKKIVSCSFLRGILQFCPFQGKQIKAVELKGKTIVALYNIDGEIFCSDANSTAYQFPLTNAKILSSEPHRPFRTPHMLEDKQIV